MCGGVGCFCGVCGVVVGVGVLCVDVWDGVGV